MFGSPIWMWIVMIPIVAVVAYFSHRAHERRKALAREVAAHAGLHVDLDRKDPPKYDFDLFGVGRSRRVTFHMWQPGTNDGVFRYQYTTGSGKNQTTYRYTCALIELPFHAPHLEIGPEGFWSKIGRAIGVRDIEVESEEFNRIFRVQCDDERFAITLLDQRMIGWMLSPNSGHGSVRFELLQNAMLCISDELGIEEMPGFLQWSQQVRERLPAVLPELYPPAGQRR